MWTCVITRLGRFHAKLKRTSSDSGWHHGLQHLGTRIAAREEPLGEGEGREEHFPGERVAALPKGLFSFEGARHSAPCALGWRLNSGTSPGAQSFVTGRSRCQVYSPNPRSARSISWWSNGKLARRPRWEVQSPSEEERAPQPGAMTASPLTGTALCPVNLPSF